MKGRATGSMAFIPARTKLEAFAPAAECLFIAIPDSLALAAVVVERTARAWTLNLIREFQTRDAGWQRIVEGLTHVLLGHLARVLAISRSRPAWLDSVVNLAREHCTLLEIAIAVGRHPSHVAREFRRHEGVSIGEYARRCRLELAARTLRSSDRSIAAIAVASGFCDQSHFTNAFRRVFGVTPAAYRQSARSRPATGARI